MHADASPCFDCGTSHLDCLARAGEVQQELLGAQVLPYISAGHANVPACGGSYTGSSRGGRRYSTSQVHAWPALLKLDHHVGGTALTSCSSACSYTTLLHPGPTVICQAECTVVICQMVDWLPVQQAAQRCIQHHMLNDEVSFIVHLIPTCRQIRRSGLRRGRRQLQRQPQCRPSCVMCRRD